MGKLQNISADIPAELRGADELLRIYGRWAMHRHKRQHCGSAEGRYSIPPNDDDREPREALMLTADAMHCQRALAQVPANERIVLAILYVPQRLPVEVQLRRLHIPPRLSQERHRTGLVMFKTRHRVLALDTARHPCVTMRHLTATV